jgi:hypothetical protein
MRDKELFAILGVLVTRAGSVVLTRPNVDRAADPAALAAALPAGGTCSAGTGPFSALDLARSLARRDGRRCW